MLLTDSTPKGGKNLQLNCMKIGGSVSYVVSELCSNIYLPAEFSLPSSLAVRVCLVYCLFYFFSGLFFFPQPIRQDVISGGGMQGLYEWLHRGSPALYSAGVLLETPQSLLAASRHSWHVTSGQLSSGAAQHPLEYCY